MSEHPIEGLMNTAMNSIKDMIDVDTIIGEPIETSNNIIIIPISKVSFGFASGGSEFKGETVDEYTKKDKEEAIQYRLPFGGGSGAGVNINPVAFLVIQSNNVKLLPIDHSSCIDRLIDYVPDLIEKTSNVIGDKKEKKDNIKNKMDNIKLENEIIKKIKPQHKKEIVNYEFEYNDPYEENQFKKFEDYNNYDD